MRNLRKELREESSEIRLIFLKKDKFLPASRVSASCSLTVIQAERMKQPIFAKLGQ